MKTILVTGGLGYIGSHTVVELVANGYRPVVVDNLANSTESVVERLEKITNQALSWYKEDINNTASLSNIIAKEKVEAVIHFAAYKAVGESVEKPLDYFENNVGGLLSLLRAMENNDVTDIVFSSSCTVYGDTKNSPIDELQARTSAISPYGTTKIICEEILEDCANHGHNKVVSLRYFNPVGAHESALIGELPIGIPNNLVPYITQTAAGIRETLTVFGNDYNTPDGSNIRDFIHVVDLAIAHVRALQYAEKESFKFEVFNLGTGRGESVLDVVKSFEKVTGKKLNYVIGSRRAGDVEQIWADSSKAKEKLNWVAVRSLDEMMLSAWKWQQRLS